MLSNLLSAFVWLVCLLSGLAVVLIGASAEGGASLADGGVSAAALAWRAALASVAVGGGAAASVPARSASALYWAWVPAA